MDHTDPSPSNYDDKRGLNPSEPGSIKQKRHGSTTPPATSPT